MFSATQRNLGILLPNKCEGALTDVFSSKIHTQKQQCDNTASEATAIPHSVKYGQINDNKCNGNTVK